MAFDEDVRIQLKRSFADFLERDYALPDDPAWNYAKGLQELYADKDVDGDKVNTSPSHPRRTHTHSERTLHACHEQHAIAELLNSAWRSPTSERALSRYVNLN